MSCPDCCAFHDALRWIVNAFETGELWLGFFLGIVSLSVLALCRDYF